MDLKAIINTVFLINKTYLCSVILIVFIRQGTYSTSINTNQNLDQDLVFYNISPTWIYITDLPTTIFLFYNGQINQLHNLTFIGSKYGCRISATINSTSSVRDGLAVDLVRQFDTKPDIYTLVNNSQGLFLTDITLLIRDNLVTPAISNTVMNISSTTWTEPIAITSGVIENITGVDPDTIFTIGGIRVTIYGSGMEEGRQSELIVVIYTIQENNQINLFNKSEPCNIINSTQAICIFPLLNIEDLLQNYTMQWNSIPSIKYATQRKREASYKQNAYINVSTNVIRPFTILPIRFYDEKPEFESSGIVFNYYPRTKESLKITGRNILKGCKREDYTIELGVLNCPLLDAKDNYLSCQPPEKEPQPSPEYLQQCNNKETVALVVQLGVFRHPTTLFFIQCVDFKDDKLELALGLGLGLGLMFLLLLAAVIAVYVYCYIRKSKEKVKLSAWEHNDKVVREHTEKIEKLRRATATHVFLEAAGIDPVENYIKNVNPGEPESYSTTVHEEYITTLLNEGALYDLDTNIEDKSESTETQIVDKKVGNSKKDKETDGLVDRSYCHILDDDDGGQQSPKFPKDYVTLDKGKNDGTADNLLYTNLVGIKIELGNTSSTLLKPEEPQVEGVTRNDCHC